MVGPTFGHDALRYHGDIAARGARVDFAVNVQGSMPDWIAGAVIDAVADLTPYPDTARDLRVRTLLGALHGRPAEEVLLLGGVAEGFSLLPNLDLAPMIVYPQFTEPEAAFVAAGRPVHRAILLAPFKLSADFRLLDTTGHGNAQEMVIIGNPTNPTGVLHRREEILSFLPQARLVVVDEAFMDVADDQGQSVANFRNPKLLVFRSMTKTWAMAGLRCGYALGAPEVLEKLARRRPHWPVGTLQLAAMEAVAENSTEKLPVIRKQIAACKAEMTEVLGEAGWEVLPSAAPFLLVRPCLPGAANNDEKWAIHCEYVRKKLLEHGIAVRRCDTFPGLDATWWRLAVRPRIDVCTLVETVDQIVAQQ